MSNFQEWLQTNAKGSFAFGSCDRTPRRKYHSLFTQRKATYSEPINWLSEVIETFELPELIQLVDIDFGNPQSESITQRLYSFSAHPVPTWIYKFGPYTLTRSLELLSSQEGVALTYKLEWDQKHTLHKSLEMSLRPLFLARPCHQLHHCNHILDGKVEQVGNQKWSFKPYAALPSIEWEVFNALSEFASKPYWYKNLQYSEERNRGYENIEDCFVPGLIKLKLKNGVPAQVCLTSGFAPQVEYQKKAAQTPDKTSFKYLLEESAACYRIQLNNQLPGIIAGYPWFDVWARDTMIALPGLVVSTELWSWARELLQPWGEVLTRGKKIPGLNETGVDSPLLYIRALRLISDKAPPPEQKKMISTCLPYATEIVRQFFENKLPHVQVTPSGVWVKPTVRPSGWMDAVVDGAGVTPRNNYAIDLCVLFMEAVDFICRKDKSSPSSWKQWQKKAETSFSDLFWNPALQYFADTTDGKHQDTKLRPNQLWALASALPIADIKKRLAALAIIENRLVTPVGLRTLAPDDIQYHGQCVGDQRTRDLAYHQGTVWPWLLGIYADAIEQTQGAEQVKSAMTPILTRMQKHFSSEACLFHISEIFDGDTPHVPRGAPAQAWSLSEILRIIDSYPESTHALK